MLGFEVVCNPDFTAKQAIELGLTSHIAKCEEEVSVHQMGCALLSHHSLPTDHAISLVAFFG